MTPGVRVADATSNIADDESVDTEVKQFLAEPRGDHVVRPTPVVFRKPSSSSEDEVREELIIPVRRNVNRSFGDEVFPLQTDWRDQQPGVPGQTQRKDFRGVSKEQSGDHQAGRKEILEFGKVEKKDSACQVDETGEAFVRNQMMMKAGHTQTAASNSLGGNSVGTKPPINGQNDAHYSEPGQRPQQDSSLWSRSAPTREFNGFVWSAVQPLEIPMSDMYIEESLPNPFSSPRDFEVHSLRHAQFTTREYPESLDGVHLWVNSQNSLQSSDAVGMSQEKVILQPAMTALDHTVVTEEQKKALNNQRRTKSDSGIGSNPSSHGLYPGHYV